MTQVNSNRKSIIILLGSGVPSSVGFPTVHDITGTILRGEISHDGNNYMLGDRIVGDETTRTNLALVARLKTECDSFFFPFGHETTYEDIAYLCTQISDHNLLEYENPAVKPLIDRILSEMNTIFNIDRYQGNHSNIGQIAADTRDMIVDIVCSLLRNEPDDLIHTIPRLSLIQQFIASDFDIINIFTLNHDRLIEQYLVNGRTLIDGFGVQDVDIRHWQPNTYDESRNNADPVIKLFKLHGSIDWFNFRREKTNECVTALIHINRIPTVYTETFRDSTSNLLPDQPRPEILIGTFNKILDYNRDLFLELHWRFKTELNENNFLVVAGYGFGDKGVNSRIVAWIYASSSNKLIIIHPNFIHLLSNARGAIRTMFARLPNQIIRIEKRIENTTFTDIEEYL